MNSERPLPHPALSLLCGMLLSAGISAALVIATAKAGISPGVSPLVVLLGWILLAKQGQRLHGTLALLQVTGSGGAAVSAGVIFTAPIIQVYSAQKGIAAPPVDVVNLILASLAGAFLGWGFVGLATQRFLTDTRLPAPEAVACDRLINTAAESPDQRPKILTSLCLGLAVGTVVKGLQYFKYFKEEAGNLKVPLPEALIKDGFKLPFPASPLLLGIGALLTLPTALLIFGGALINSVTTAYSAAEGLPGTTFRWVGGAAMAVAVTWSLIQYVRDGIAQRKALAAAEPGSGDTLLEIPGGQRALLIGSIVLGAILFFATLTQSATTHLADSEVSIPLVVVVVGGVALVLVAFLSGLGALLSLQVGASASPVSGTVFMAMLVLSVTALGVSLSGGGAIQFLTPALVATCVAICAANDASQDYKTMQLNGYAVHKGFNGQLLGLLAGALVVPLALRWGTGDAPLGGTEYPCPQAAFFGTALQSLFDADSGVPWKPVIVGAILGVGAVIMEILGRRKGVLLSPLALAVGIYLPATLGVGILLGALARFLASFKTSSSTHSGILTAAGLISGYALFSLVVGCLITGGHEEFLSRLTWKAESQDSEQTVAWGAVVSWTALGVLVASLWWNYWSRDEDAA